MNRPLETIAVGLSCLGIVACAPATPAAPTALASTVPEWAIALAAPPAPLPRRRVPVAVPPAFASSPELEALRDPRPPRAHQSRKVMVNMNRAMHIIYDHTPKDSPHRPALMRDLAENCVDIEQISAHDRDESHALAATDIPYHGWDAEERKAELIRRSAWWEALDWYSKLVKEYPAWCPQGDARSPERDLGCIDESIYLLGFEWECAGEPAMAGKVYLDVVRDWPGSRYAGYAYLAFGELLLARTPTHPESWELAEMSYDAVLKDPTRRNEVYSYAALRRGQMYRSRGEAAKANQLFDIVKRLGAANPGLRSMAIPASFVTP